MSHHSGEAPVPILFVCTGNTCRSPMAEGILRRRFLEREGSAWTVESAGTFAIDGCPASPPAIEVCREHGIDITGHRSRLLTEDVVARAGLILAMEEAHRGRVIELGGAGRVYLLAAFPDGVPDHADGIADPAGGERSWYETVYDRLEREIDRIVEHLTDEEAAGG